MDQVREHVRSKCYQADGTPNYDLPQCERVTCWRWYQLLRALGED